MSINASLLGPAVPPRGRMPFTSSRSRRGFNLNQCLSSLLEPRQREAFNNNPDAYMKSHSLTEQERALIHERDFTGLLDYGACLLNLGTLMRVFGISLVEFGAAARGQSVAEFMAHKRAESEDKPWQF